MPTSKKGGGTEKSPAGKKIDATKRTGNGFCPKCGSDWVVKTGMTTNAGSEKQNYRCKSCDHRTTSPSKDKPKPTVPVRSSLPKVQRYLVTAAQNATPIRKNFWKSFEICAKYYDAERVVLQGRYKNPTSQWTQNNVDHEWWAPEVVPFLCTGWNKLNENLLLLGGVKVQWAAADPLAGLDGLTKGRSGILGHGCRAMRSIATPQHKHPKVMYTTGACTEPNYTDTKRGKMGEFNHCISGLIVEIDGDTFHIRELNATKDGSFIDLDMEFTPDGVRPVKSALSITTGDTHRRWILSEVVKATFTAKDSLVNLLKPRYLFWHDLIDGHARNHHHRKDWILNVGKWKARKECVRTEIQEGVAFANKHTPEGCHSIVVPSNHNDVVGKWLRETDPREDPVNAEFWLEIATAALKDVKVTGGGIEYEDPFIAYAKKLAKPNVKFLRRGQSFVLSHVEYGFHGDIGPNGARGTTKNLSRLGVKVTKGHSHAAEIVGGCYSVGKSTGMLEYERGGPSNHTNAHVVQYSNGKRTIVIIINGRYCLPRPKRKT